MSGPSRREFLAAAALLPGCAASLADFPFDRGLEIPGPLGLTLEFYSVTCALIRGPGGAVLCDPFFTHLPLSKLLFGQSVTDPLALRPFRDRLGDVRAVVVGHVHYDHAMAVPAVDPYLADDAVFLGSETLAHTFAASPLTHPLVTLNQQVATKTTPGQAWVHPGGGLRIRPILSGHPPQWAFFHLFPHRVSAPRTQPPTRVNHYQEGITLAYLIDFLDGDDIAARVYVQSSSTGPPAGFFPRSLLDERGVDLALVSMDVANREQAHGDSVLHLLKPRTVAFTHYEDFFRPKDKPPREIVKVNLEASRAFFEDTEETRYLFPGWDSRFAL